MYTKQRDYIFRKMFVSNKLFKIV